LDDDDDIMQEILIEELELHDEDEEDE